jgi:S-adenosylmethionine synthetase
VFADRLADGVVNVSLKAENHVRVACEPASRCAKLVIRLRFVTLQRSEMRVVGRRIRVREQPIGHGTSLMAS